MTIKIKKMISPDFRRVIMFAAKTWIRTYHHRLWVFFPGMKSPNRCFTPEFFWFNMRVSHLFVLRVPLVDMLLFFYDRFVSSIVHVSVCLWYQRMISLYILPLTHLWFFSESKSLSSQISWRGIGISSSKGMNQGDSWQFLWTPDALRMNLSSGINDNNDFEIVTFFWSFFWFSWCMRNWF